MNALESLMSHPAVMRTGWVLVHFLWQGAAVAALLAVALLLLCRDNGSTRRNGEKTRRRRRQSIPTRPKRPDEGGFGQDHRPSRAGWGPE